MELQMMGRRGSTETEGGKGRGTLRSGKAY